ncbi:hypothetical protein [Marinobacter sp. MDS2]|uniref:hypothetical protein n=1 Tax=Marinobacter sp. MDS2 TaxID=3065961 RepID=UPI00273C94FB|nr:hypothetical protein [Marinobacter sp. MDS2]MDP4548712.1 hypothetical protein [Marinobacter sp. MDS2]
MNLIWISRNLKNLFISSLLIFFGGCANHTIHEISDEYRKQSLDLLASYEDVNQKEEFWWDDYSLTPLSSAILFSPERVEELIKEGASVRGYVRTPFRAWAIEDGYSTSPYTVLAVNRSHWLQKYWGIDADPSIDLELTEILINAGADVDDWGGYGITAFLSLVREGWDHENSKERNDSVIRSMKVLVLKYGADPYHYTKNWPFRDNAKSLIDRRVDIYGDRYLELRAEYEKLLKLRRLDQDEIVKYLENELIIDRKVAAIQKEINGNSTLKSAFQQVVSSGKDCKTIKDIMGPVTEYRCGAFISGSGSFFSESCEAIRTELVKQLNTESSRFCRVYKEQKNQLASVLGDNANAMKTLIEDEAIKAGKNNELYNIYSREFSYVRRVKEREIQAEKSAVAQDRRQMAADFRNNIKRSLERTNRMLDRSMSRTQKMIDRAYASQRASSSSYQTRPNAATIQGLNKKLKEIDRSFEPSNSGAAPSAANSGAPGSATGKQNKVCAGPFHRPKFVEVTKSVHVPEGPKLKCPAGTTPISAGTANLDIPSKYLQGAMTPVALDDGYRRFTLEAWDYECLCGDGKSQGTGAYQQ